MRRNKLHIPHPVRRLRRTGVVRSVVPPFPTRIASLDSRGSPRPFAIPLKRPRRGLWPPSLDHPRGLVCAKIIFESTKRDADASFLNWRGSRNTLRLFQVCVERQSVCARNATLPLQEERPIDFHTSNIQRAQTKRPARRIVRSGNPILWPPEGRSLRDAPSVNSTQKQYAFSAHKRYFTFPAPFSSISFPARGAGTKLQPSAAVAIWRGRAAKCMSSAACGGTKNMELARTSPRSGGCGFANRTAPPAQRKKLTHHNTLSSYAGTA